MSKEQEHIEKIRKEKFWLDEKGQLREKNPLIDDLTNSIERLSEGLYSKDTHFIFELIQNAEDNKYDDPEASLSFQLVKEDPTSTPKAKGALIVKNNEVGFSSENVDAISAIGKTTKSKIQGYIGEKGIGFKSVFRITTIPHIFSNGYQFCFPEKDEKTGLGYIVPRWVASIPHKIDLKQTNIILPLDKPDFAYEKIEMMLHDIEPETILFLSKLKEIKIKTDSGDDLTILKDDSKSHHIQLLIEGTKQGESYSDIREFLLFNQTACRPRDISHEKRSGVDKRDVTIAFPADNNKDSMGKIFAYLPIRSDTGFPFLINADFILPSSREDIQDIPWNRWLIGCVANLLADALPLLKKEGLLTIYLLESLAKRMNELDENSIFYPIVEAVRNALLNQELLPADDGTFVSARNAKLARGADLRKLLTHDQLKELFQSKDHIKWLSGEITQDRTPDLRSYLMSELDVEEIRPETFIELLTDEFLQAQTDTWIIQFYNFLGNDRSKLWKKPDSVLRKKKILRLEEKLHVIPFRADGRPNAYLPSSSKTNFPTIKKNIFEDKGSEDFLRNLGLFEPDLFAEVIEFVFQKYTVGSFRGDFQENIEDLRKVSKVLNTPLHTKSQNSIGKLKILLSKLGLDNFLEYFEKQTEPGNLIPVLLKMVLPSIKFLRAINGNREGYKAAKEIYLNTDELRMFFGNNPNVWFLDKTYPEDLEPLFKKISVGASPRIKRENKNDKGHVVIQDSRGWHERGLNGFDPDIEVDGLKYALKDPTLQKSLFIWNRIAKENSDCIRGIVESSSRKTYENSKKQEKISHNFGRLLIDTSWLPDKQGNFHKPAELKLADLPESFVRDEKLVNQLGMKKDVVAKLAEEAGVTLDDIEKAKKISEASPEVKEQIDLLLSNSDEKQTEFPKKTPTNIDRRREKIIEKYRTAPKKKYKKKSYSKKVTKNTIDPKGWLREIYTNKEEQTICQICQKEMPFKGKDNEYYFEAVELLNDFDREMEELHIALCPLCAAMYNEFVKHDEGAMESLKNALINSEDAEIPLQLGELDTSVRFVESHFLDIRTIIEAQE